MLILSKCISFEFGISLHYRKESKFILYSGMIRGGVYSFFSVSSTVLGYLVFITLIATEGAESLVYDNLFITVSLLVTLRLFVAECSVLCLQGGAEALVALSRIQVLSINSNHARTLIPVSTIAEVVDNGQYGIPCH